MTKWFTSDLHHSHKRIVEFTNRGKDTTQENHDEWLSGIWNNQVSAGDLVYHLGDFSFAKQYEDVAGFVSKLNGQKIFIKGNHDDHKNLDKLVSDGLIQAWYEYKEIKIGSNTVCLFHFPITSWHKQGYGSWHCHGHCVDYQTEILTSKGFKNRVELSISDSVCTYNHETKQYEYSPIESIIDKNHSGEVYSYSGKSVDFRVTDQHTIVGLNITSGEYFEAPAKALPSKFKVITSSVVGNVGTGLNKNTLALYILIAADGSIKRETDLVRIRIKKKHKIEYLTKVLSDLKIEYRVYPSGEYLSFNFYLPHELKDWDIKGLDSRLLNANDTEADTIVESYRNSDGTKQSNGVIIYTAKKKEYDTLQAMFAQNGYMVTGYSRYHGFGQNLQYQLSVTSNSTQILQASKVKVENVINEKFWCITTKNQNFVVRRNGKVHLTGNCHSNLKDSKGLMLDVGLDSAFNIHGEHRFFSAEHVSEFMSKSTIYVADHHKAHTTKSGI